MNTRSRILAEAETLTRTRGFLGFSYADLSERIGIQKASIHHHFTNKEELGLALIALYRERCLSRMIAIIAQSPSAEKRLHLYGDLYTDGLKQGLACLCGMLASEITLLSTAMQDGVRVFFEEHRTWLTTILQDGKRKGEFKDKISPEEKSYELLAALQGTMFMARLSEQPQLISQVLSGLVAGLRVPQ
jgi:TetR/AcrR family transcriptional repressor of nem operon